MNTTTKTETLFANGSSLVAMPSPEFTRLTRTQWIARMTPDVPGLLGATLAAELIQLGERGMFPGELAPGASVSLVKRALLAHGYRAV